MTLWVKEESISWVAKSEDPFVAMAADFLPQEVVKATRPIRNKLEYKKAFNISSLM